MESSYQLKSGFRSGPGGPYDGTYVEDYEFVSGLGQLDRYNGHWLIHLNILMRFTTTTRQSITLMSLHIRT